MLDSSEFEPLLRALAIATAMGLYGLSRKSLSVSGCVAGLFVGTGTWFAHAKFGMLLLSFFVTSSRITKWNAQDKKKLEADYKEGGNRDWKQVLANSLTATVLCMVHWWLFGHEVYTITAAADRTTSNNVPLVWSSVIQAAIVGHYACCAGDTWASEAGIAGGDPRLITTCRRVPPGTNGGITVRGTIASALGGMTMGMTWYLSPDSSRPEQADVDLSAIWAAEDAQAWRVIPLATFAGLLGSAVDSFMGCWFQYSGFDKELKRVVNHPTATSVPITSTVCTWLSNEMVNFLSAAATSACIGYLVLFIF